MIVLYKNTSNTVRLTLYEKSTGPYYGLRLTNEMTRDEHDYVSLSDASTYPQYYNEFTITIPSTFTGGFYKYEAFPLSVSSGPITGSSIEEGKCLVVETETEVVFNTDEEKSNVVFDED